MKKLASLLLVLVMLLSICGGALAEITKDSTMTVQIPQIDDKATAYAYKIMDVTYSEDLHMVVNPGVKWATEIEAWAVPKYGLAHEFSETLSEEALEAFYIEFLIAKNNKTFGEDYKAYAQVYNDAEKPAAVELELAMGEYILIIEGTATIYSPVGLSVKPVSGELICNDFELKSESPIIEKTISEKDEIVDNGVGVGSIVPFEITTTVPVYSSDYENVTFNIIDTLSAGLELIIKEPISDNFTIKLGDEPLTNLDHYRVVKGEESGPTFTIEFNYETLPFADSGSRKITVNYDVLINDEVSMVKDANNNAAQLYYSTTPTTVTEGEKKTVPVYTFGFELVKYHMAGDGTKTKELLPGATFELYATDKDGKIINEPLLFKSTTDSRDIAILDLEPKRNTINRYKLSIAGSKDLVVDANGLLYITGLDEGIYYLKEINAPSGYNAVDGYTKIEIVQDGSSELLKNGSQYYHLEVENKKGIALPPTGGIGTTIFTIVGIVIMAGVVILLISRNRKKNV